QTARPDEFAIRTEAQQQARGAMGVDILRGRVRGESGPAEPARNDVRVVDVDAVVPELLARLFVEADDLFTFVIPFAGALDDEEFAVEDERGGTAAERLLPEHVPLFLESGVE